jgi:general stress protein 26
MIHKNFNSEYKNGLMRDKKLLMYYNVTENSHFHLIPMQFNFKTSRYNLIYLLEKIQKKFTIYMELK